MIEQKPRVDYYRQQIEDAMPEHFYQPNPQQICGNCINYDPERGLCTARDLRVRAEDPMCELYIPEPSDPADDES